MHDKEKSERFIFIVKWNNKSESFAQGSCFLDVKKAFGWKNNVLLIETLDGSQRETLELRETLERDYVVEPLGFGHEQAREALRHTASHILAQAVKRLFPDVRLGIGPAIEDGFYYDFDTVHGFTPEDLVSIEQEMKRIAKQNLPVTREIMSRGEARKVFEQSNETFKIEILDELPENEPISVYRQGEFIDLCAGPHVPYTGYLKAFKLLNIAGAYWRGDENRPMLQRIYGTAFMDQEGLRAHLARLEEIKQRDHRKLGKQLDLFSIEEDAGPGLVYWHPKGAIVREIIENYWKEGEQVYHNGKEWISKNAANVWEPGVVGSDIWEVIGAEEEQESYPEWDSTQHWSTYSIGDRRTWNGAIYECKAPEWAQSYVPDSEAGLLYGWTKLTEL